MSVCTLAGLMPDVLPPHVRIQPARGLAALRLSELWVYRDVLFMLALRDIKLRYKQTALGVAWVVLQPLLAGAIFAVIFGRFAQLPSGGRPYVLFVFASLLGWNLFSGVLQRAGNSLIAEARLISKVYFPRLLIPCAAALAALVDFAVSLAMMTVLLAWFGIWPGPVVFFLPAVVFVTLLLALGISFWASALTVRYRDFLYVLPFLVQAWMYASPVVYGLELVPAEWRGWFALNPMTGLIEAFRACLLGTGDYLLIPIVVAIIIAVLALLSGAFFFRYIEREIADTL